MPLDPPISPDVRAWVGSQADGDELARAWALAALAEAPVPAGADAAWARLAERLDAHPVAADRPVVRPRRRRWLVGALAVAAAVAVAVGLAVSDVRVQATSDVVEVALADGSAVTLAPGSEIAYRRGLRGRTRSVELVGQARFAVEPDGRTFRVETAAASVEVLGTTFDVRAWPSVRAPETAVVLVEGSVRLSGSAGTVLLRPGETSRVGTDGVPTPPAPADVEAATAWRDGGFSVADAPLDAVAAAVEARFGRAVRLAPGVDGRQRLTLYLPTAATADAVLGDVAAYLGLRLQAGPDRYQLLPR